VASNTLIGQWSSGLWQDLGSLPTLSALTISGYAVQPSTLGRLNTLIGTCYSGTGYMGTGIPFDAAPDLSNTELAVIGAMFEVGWYSQLAMTMMGVTPAGLAWTALAEGDSRISRANAVNVGKEYREMSKEANLRLNYLVNAYHTEVQGSSTPRDVSYLNPGFSNLAYPYGRPGGVSP
jgi:hypothetical protein